MQSGQTDGIMSTVTLRDVASKAGVSIGTASQALNNRSNVSPDTRERVFNAASSLGYEIKLRQNSNLGTAISVLGLLTKHDFGLHHLVNPFYSHIQAGVESECRRRNLSLMYANIEVDQSNRPVIWPAMITKQHIDGLVVAGTFIEDTIGMINQHANTNIVLVDSYAPTLALDSVVIDNIGGAASAVRFLVQNGHRHIGMIGTNPLSPPGVLQRRYGYQKALDELCIQDQYIEDSTLSRDNSYEATLRLLQRMPQITAIFAANDDTAIGVIHAAQDLGLQVPQDMSVIGFDDIDLSREVKPALTTIRVHKTWMGALAVRFLIERVLNPDQPKVEVSVSTELVVRETVAPPRTI